MNKKGGLKAALVAFLVLLLAGLLAFYWLMPFNSIDFIPSSGNTNFSLDSSYPAEMQFYPNLRYPSSEISYNIDSSLCTLKKQDDMARAIEIVDNITSLSFHEDGLNSDILITCDDSVIVNEAFFVAGEGGPVNISKSGPFNVISAGKVLLLRESACETPNVAIHELLHALGFNHSTNKNNIMYPVTRCGETIGQDIPAAINEIYSVPSYSNLVFGDVTASIHGRYLDTNITILNYGLIDSENFEMEISAKGAQIEKQKIAPLDIGSGITFSFKNIMLANSDVGELEYSLQTDFNELNKSDNQIKLKIKE